MQDKASAALVIGAGVGGIRAALDLAESGYKTYLVDSSPAAGGTVPQLDKWFPDNQCELCKLLPVFSRDECSQVCLRRDLAHPNIEMLTNTIIEKVDGEAGNFSVSVKTLSGWVKKERCTACGLCAGACPVEVPDEYNDGLQNRKAIYVRSPQAIPNFFSIDYDACTRCGKCVEVCPTNAIDLDLEDESRELSVGAIIISAGFQEYDAAEMGQYGFGRFPNVLTNLQAERLLSSTGKTEGGLVRPSDGRTPEKVAFLQCVGSRDMNRNYCSAACCMYALKESILIKEKSPGTDVTIFYMDIRDFGKDYYRYHRKAEELGVKFVRCRVSTIKQNPGTKDLLLLARAEDGTDIRSEFDMVVLAAAQCPSRRMAELTGMLGVDTNQWGFVRTQEWRGTRTSKDGIFVCGSAAAPADISDSVIQASAAAGEAAALLSPAKQEITAAAQTTDTASTGDPGIAVFICKCGEEIPAVVDTTQVAEFARSLPAVKHAEEVEFLCLPETIEEVKKTVTDTGVNRVILAACAPYHYQRLFGKAMQEAGIDASLWQLVNFREQLAWVHKENTTLANEKARSTLAVAVDRLRNQEPLAVTPGKVEHQALVVGGGVSGLVATLSLAELGFEVHLVEKTAETGGHITDIRYIPGNDNPKSFIDDIREKVAASSNVHLYLESEVIETSGHTGDFHSKIRGADETVTEINHGATIIATGAKDYQPVEYDYGEDDRIITQNEFQKRLAGDSLEKPSTVVMVQCVGSRDEEHPYCNRTCCSTAIASALKIKEQNPDTEVFILNRDIMTYAFREEYYSQAREAGVLFIRYSPDNKPEVAIDNGILTVRVDDPVLPGKLEIETDLLVLSTGIVAEGNEQLAELFSVDLNEDGFFKEVDVKFRPVDTVVDGIFICGRANAPRNLDEEVVQAQAAAQRAANILSRQHIESGRIVSMVDSRRCSGCWLCVDNCPFKARWMDVDNKIAVVEEALCQGCGACVALCPNSAAKLKGFREKQMLSMIETAL